MKTIIAWVNTHRTQIVAVATVVSAWASVVAGHLSVAEAVSVTLAAAGVSTASLDVKRESAKWQRK